MLYAVAPFKWSGSIASVLSLDFRLMQLPAMVALQPFCNKFADTYVSLFAKWEMLEIHNIYGPGGWCFSASAARDYGLYDMMWTCHKLCRQSGVPSHWLQTKLDTSAQWCSTTSHNIIMTARQLRGRTEFSSPLIFSPSIHLSPGMCVAGLRSGVTVISLKWMCDSGLWVCVYVNAGVTECETAVACHALIKVHSTRGLRGLCDVN